MPAVMMTKVMPTAMMPVSDTARTILAMLSGRRNRIFPCRRGEKITPPSSHDDEPDDALESHRDRAAGRRRAARRRSDGIATAGVIFVPSPFTHAFPRRLALDRFAKQGSHVRTRAGPNSATVRPRRMTIDPVAKANQLRHFARSDQHAQSLFRQVADARVNLAFGADVDAARRFVEQQQSRLGQNFLGEHDLLLISARQRRRPRDPAAAAARRMLITPCARASVSRARDIKKPGETRLSTTGRDCGRRVSTQHQAAAAPVVGDEGQAARARRGDRAERGRPPGHLDCAAPSPARPRRRRAPTEVRCGRRPSCRRARRSRRHAPSSETSRGACQPGRSDLGDETRRAPAAALGAPNVAGARRKHFVERPADQQAHEFAPAALSAGSSPTRARRAARSRGRRRAALPPAGARCRRCRRRARHLTHHLNSRSASAARQRRGRLVHHQNARRIGQRLDDGHDLPLPDAQFADGLAAVEFDAGRRQRARASRSIAALSSPAGAHQFAAEKQIGGDVEARHEIEFLKDGGDAAACAPRGSAKRTGSPSTRTSPRRAR